MNTVTIVVLLVVTLPLFVISGFLLRGKGAFLINGYNMLSPAEREKLDERALCRFVGRLLIVINLGTIMIFVGAHAEFFWLIYLSIFVILAGSVVAVIYTGSRFQRFRKKGDLKEEELAAARAREPMPKGQKAILVTTLVVGVITLVGVAALFYFGEREPQVGISWDHIQIHGMYGVRVDFSEIAEITLLDQSMRDIGIGMRTNGFGGRALKGHFTAGLLFVMPDSVPTIRIQRTWGSDIYLSFADSERTQMVYYELVAELSRSH
ncbi:MAG: DUF3784 domain-containing protein [Oscillospiraceae bacterium]|nr:DUF3784 domain-containing protein [Oscillospiraceae bacterium]